MTLGALDGRGFRPPTHPRALAANNPAFVLSCVRRRSNWDKEEKILKINSPEAVVVSMAPSQMDLKLTPC